MSLHQQFVQLGQNHKEILRKIASLLPQIHKQEIYKKYTDDIYEYARKYAGISSGVAEEILRVHRSVEGKPEIVKAIATAGIHKVAMAAKIATVENQMVIADKINNLSKAALEQFVKDYRRAREISLFGEVEEIVKVELDKEMQFLLNKLKKKFGDGLSNKETLRKILREMCEIKFESESCKIGANITSQQNSKISKSFPGEKWEECEEKIEKLDLESENIKISRYIPVKIQRAVISNTNGKCAVHNCTKPYDHIHHQIPFSVSKNHDSIIPLCKEHHEIAHNGVNPLTGEILRKEAMSNIDLLFRKYRKFG